MKKINFWKMVVIYALIFLFFTLVFLLSFRLPIFINQKVLFYRGIELLIIDTVFVFILAVLVERFLVKISYETLIAALIMSVSLNLSFFVIFPVTFDRSVTMYLLSKLETKPASEKCLGWQKGELEQKFIDGYVIQADAVGRRISEQSIIDMLREKNGCVELTSKGRGFLRFSEAVKKFFRIN